MGKVRRLFKHTAVYSIGLFLKKAIGFFLIPIYTRVLPPSEYGILALSYLFVSFSLLFSALGLNTAFFKWFTSEGREKEAASTLLWFKIFIISPVLLIFMIFSKPISLLVFRKSLPELIILSILIVITENIATFFTLILRAEEKSFAYVLVNTVRFLLNMGLNIVFVVVFRLGVKGILFGDLISLVFLIILALPFVFKHFAWTLDRELLKKMFGYGLPLLPLTLIMLLLELSDRYLINIFKGTGEAGIYTLGYQFGTILQLFILGFRFAWEPFFFKNPEEKELFSRAGLLFLRIGLFMWTGLVFLLPEIFKIFVSPVYHSSMAVVSVVAAGYIFFGLHEVFSAPFFIHSRTKLLIPIAGASFLLNFLLNLYFIPRWGGMGAAFTTLLSYFVLAILSYIYAQKIMRVPHKLTAITIDTVVTFLIYVLLKDTGLIVRLSAILIVSIYLYLRSFKMNLKVKHR